MGGVVVAVVAALSGAACRVDVAVDVAVRPDGAGMVTVAVDADEDVLAARPGIVDELVLDDLDAAGWQVDGPVTTLAGGLRLELVKGFASPSGAGSVLDELTGPDGPLGDVELEVQPARTRTTYGLAGTVDLGAGVEAFGDEGLAEVVGGGPLGVDDEELERRVGGPLEDAVVISLGADLPGAAARTRHLPLGESTVVDLRSEVGHADRVWWALASGVAASSALGVVLLSRWRTRRGPT